MTDRQTIREAFAEAWETLEAVGWTDGIKEASARQIYVLAWRTCEARQEHKDSAGELRIVPAASP
jgi:hypothetical protein